MIIFTPQFQRIDSLNDNENKKNITNKDYSKDVLILTH